MSEQYLSEHDRQLLWSLDDKLATLNGWLEKYHPLIEMWMQMQKTDIPVEKNRPIVPRKMPHYMTVPRENWVQGDFYDNSQDMRACTQGCNWDDRGLVICGGCKVHTFAPL